MIYGLTHTADKIPVQRLAVNTRVAIGMKDPAKGYPKKIDYFMFTHKNPEGEWIENKDLTRRMAEKYSKIVPASGDKKELRLPVREFEIIFLSDNIDEVFRTELAWWSATEKICGGDGQAANRIASKVTDKALLEEHKGERTIPWSPCGESCPDRVARRCKPSGTLHFILSQDPVIGSVAAFNTTSWKTIAQVHSSLEQIKLLTGGRLRGIPLMMVLKPGKTSYKDANGATKSGTAYFVNIEFRASDYKRLIPELIEQSHAYSTQRLLNPTPKTAVVEEDSEIVAIEDLSEAEQAEIMGAEFYPDNKEEPGAETVNVQLGTDASESGAKTAATMVGCTPAQMQVLYGTMKNWDKVSEFLTQLQNEFSRIQVSDADRNGYLKRAAMSPGAVLQEMQAIPDPPVEPKSGSKAAKAQQNAKVAARAAAPLTADAGDAPVPDMNF